MEKIVLIDGHSILNRAYYGVPDLTNSEGLHTNAVYGFLNIMFKILEEEQPQYFAVAFDLSAPTFRHKRYAAYKGTRKPMQEELRQQVPVMQEMLTAMGVPLMMLEGYEADDLLGTVGKKAEQDGLEVVIVSGDRDLLQLASEHIMIRIPKTKRTGTEIEDYRAKDVLERCQVTPDQIIELKALMGDASDNIPGIPGVGEKTATKLIVQYGNIENAHAHLEEVKPNRARESLREHYDLAVLSRDLATININSPFTLDLEEARLGNLYTEAALSLCRKLEFKNLLSRFQTEQQTDTLRDGFRAETDFGAAQQIFAQAAQADCLGFAVLAAQRQVVGLALCWAADSAVYLPAQGFLTPDYLLDQLAEILNSVPKAVTLNLKEQLGWIRGWESLEDRLEDAVIGAYLLNPIKGSYPYEDLAREYADRMIPSTGELFGKKKSEAALLAGEETADAVRDYGCYLAWTSRTALPEIRRRLAETQMERLYEDMELPLVYTLYGMQREGIRADAGQLQDYASKLAVRIGELEQEIYQDAGEKFNINSPKQLGVILFEKLQIPGSKKTKSGYSTAADILENLAPDYPIIEKILEYRQLTKLKSTYADGLTTFIAEDGRIHGTFHQTITATGRISSADPNLQNIPIRTELGRLFRKVFLPRDGWEFVDADYSQIELRVLAALSGDEALCEAFRNHQDIHALTASQVFHVPFAEVTPLQRRNAKAVNFGIVYGISAFGLSRDLKISRKEAADYIEHYFAAYPKIKIFLDQAVAEAKKQGYTETWYHRRRPIPELSSGNFMQRSFGERVAMNSPIQGTAADIIKIAMVQVERRLRQEGLRAKLVLQVHDELLIESPTEEIEQVRRILQEEMTGASDLSVPMETDINSGRDWYEAH